MSKYVALTGAAGFIGRVVCRQLLERGDRVYAVDSFTYAADPQCLQQLDRQYPGQLSIVANDIRNLGRWPAVDAVLHLAAESHVDNSVDTPTAFIETNVNGTAHLLEMTRRRKPMGAPHFIYVSTDEVYGSVEDGQSSFYSPLRPSSPYAASKAAADLLVQAWGHTYGLPYTIVRPTNCYGAGQYPEKLIPTAIRSLVLGRPIPIHGDGLQTRQWLWVDDLASALLFVLDHPDWLPQIVNVGGNKEASVNDVAREVVYAFDAVAFAWDHTEHGHSRPGQDMRYSVDDSPLRNAGWEPKGDFWAQLPEIVAQEAKSFRF